MNKTGKGQFVEKFSTETKEQIATDYKNGKSVRQLNEKYGCCRNTIKKILVAAKIYSPQQNFCKRYQVNYRFFDKIDNEKKAYWLGFIAADGYLSETNGYLTISLKWSDAPHLTKFLSDLSSTHEVKTTYATTGNKKHKRGTVTIYSREMVNSLLKHGIYQGKSHTLTFPKITKRLYPHYIRGYLDGDGSWYLQKKKYPALRFIGSSEFITELQKILMEECNLPMNKLMQTKSNNIIRLGYTGGIHCRSLYHYFYDKCSICLERKRDKVKSYFIPDRDCPITRVMINRFSKLKSSVITKRSSGFS